jgi:pyrophosphatase PpaX
VPPRYFSGMYSTARARRSPNRPLAVLFDLDGTLIDSIELILSSMRHAFAKCQRPVPTDAEWLTGVGTPLPTMFRNYVTEDAHVAELIAAYREHQMAHHDALVRCYAEVADMLSALAGRGHPMAVVTSKSDALARRGLEYAGILQFFESIVGFDSTTRHKPHPEPVLTALDRLGYEPCEAAFVGDSVHDVEAGNAAGVVTVAALWGPFTREQLAAARPRLFAERPGALPQLVSEL